jgi:hypothetical protein
MAKEKITIPALPVLYSSRRPRSDQRKGYPRLDQFFADLEAAFPQACVRHRRRGLSPLTETRFCSTASSAVRGAAGNWSTVAL